MVVQAHKSGPKRAFGDELAASIGGPSIQEAELPPVYAELMRLVDTPVAIYIEDDTSGMGACAVCGKKGVLGRCFQCGLLMHHTCVSPQLPGRRQPCPRCLKGEQEIPEEWWKMGIHKHKFGRGAITPGPVGLDKGLDARFPR